MRAPQEREPSGPKINDLIRAREVMLIAEDGTKVGVVSRFDALAKAQSVLADDNATQADIDAGSFANSATVNGKDPKNATVSATNGTTVPLTKAPSLAMDKTTTTASFAAGT